MRSEVWQAATDRLALRRVAWARTSFAVCKTSCPRSLNVLRPLTGAGRADGPASGSSSSPSSLAWSSSSPNMNGTYDASYVTECVLPPTRSLNASRPIIRVYAPSTPLRRRPRARPNPPRIPHLLRHRPFRVVLDLRLFGFHLRLQFRPLRVLHEPQAQRAVADRFS